MPGLDSLVAAMRRNNPPTVAGGLGRAVNAMGFGAPATVQTLIGLAQGFGSGRMPQMAGDSIVFEAPAGSTPRASGQVVFLPPEADETTAIHEGRHATQAASVPLAPLIGNSMFGNLYTNPLEMDAYAAQPRGPQRDEDMGTISALVGAGGSRAQRTLLDLIQRLHSR